MGSESRKKEIDTREEESHKIIALDVRSMMNLQHSRNYGVGKQSSQTEVHNASLSKSTRNYLWKANRKKGPKISI